MSLSDLVSSTKVVRNDVHEGRSDNNKTITQPLDDTHNRSIFVGKFPSQAPSYGSSVEDEEEINSSLRPFDRILEMDIQLHEKRDMAKYSNTDATDATTNHPTSSPPSPLPSYPPRVADYVSDAQENLCTETEAPHQMQMPLLVSEGDDQNEAKIKRSENQSRQTFSSCMSV
ncbi:hypothetical protein Cgig2_032658 [Carnegiea gigantea]|uniref:Uncharacterized protein n=1 Tax=Carnegiea gigantea TaxID=171969 RepID=A0A9Q1K113_9CARY|nr:hypothetical protein Cgig2_032658 [Carnegiea gigantea]